MTIFQFVLMSPILRMPVSHPGNLWGRICCVWTSEVDGKKTGIRSGGQLFLVESPQFCNQVLIFHDTSGPCLTVSGLHKVTVVPVRRNGIISHWFVSVQCRATDVSHCPLLSSVEVTKSLSVVYYFLIQIRSHVCVLYMTLCHGWPKINMHEACKSFAFIVYTEWQYYSVVFFGTSNFVVILSQRVLKFRTARNLRRQKKAKGTMCTKENRQKLQKMDTFRKPKDALG